MSKTAKPFKLVVHKLSICESSSAERSNSHQCIIMWMHGMHAARYLILMCICVATVCSTMPLHILV